MAPGKEREGMNDKERLQEIKEYLFRSTRIANEKELEYEKWIISRVENLLQENEKLKWHNQNLMNSGYEYTFELERKLQQAQAKAERYEKALREIAINCDTTPFNYIAKQALEGDTQ
jgi:CRISPR/Cas system-associated protein Cas5 (RAMP superfamily)